MGLRPSAARWFEVLTPREQLTSALSCLASTGAVELQTHSQAEAVVVLPGLEAGLAEYEELEQRYAVHWPDPALEREGSPRDPDEVLESALGRLRAWADEADEVVRALDRLETESAELEALLGVLQACGDRLPDLERLAAAGPYLSSRFYRMPSATAPETLAPSVIVQWVDCGGAPHLLATGPVNQVERLDEQLVQLKATRIAFPAWLPGDADGAIEAVREHIATNRREHVTLVRRLRDLDDRHRVAEARGDMRFLAWFQGCAPALPVTEHFAWITGWTSDVEGSELEGALEAGRVEHVLRFTDPPPGAQSPVVLHNPKWVRPFEVFARLMGVPAGNEADPSAVVSLVAPLMFGYMFGDVGQGAVLLALGLALRRRFPVLSLLVPGGLFAIIFGFAFGSVFSMEGIIPALWLHPMDEPLMVLGVTLVAGVVILGLGLLLDFVQATWRRQTGRWLAIRGGLATAWLGAVLSLPWPGALWLLVVGAAWFVAGRTLLGTRSIAGFAGSLGELVESLLQLLVNTVSFVRVGAFALAHAGLSSAVVAMSQATGSVWGSIPVLVLGNAGIIALEGLVVGIQTTRLVLFEFFTRFLEASGRPFRPLAHLEAPDGRRS
jgi:V/A-type H+-transporting ATPase subunit I